MTTQDQTSATGVTRADVLQATQAVTSRFGDEYFGKLDKEEGYPHDYIKALMDAGLHTVMIPAEYGGMGLGVCEAAVIVEEMHRCGGVGSMIHGQMFMMGILARHGTHEQKRKILEEVVAGRVRLQSFSLTEPNAGTDTSQMSTKATKEGNEWVIKGQKLWTSRFDYTDAFMVFARTSPPKDPAKACQGISAFLVDKRQVDPKQYTSRKIDVMFNHHTYEVFYDNMRIPERSLIGEEGKGFKYLIDGLNAEKFDRREPCGGEANIAKMLASDASWELANVCMQTHGGMGLAREYHIERRFRDTRVFQIAPISPNMILNYVSQHVLGLPRSY